MRPKQSLGQNFLIDDNIVRKTMRALAPSPSDAFIEIGPGHGALTRFLAPRVRSLVLIEIDKRIVAELQAAFPEPHVEIVQQDILETDFSYWCTRFGARFRLAGNIPYHLTSPILFKVFEHAEDIIDCTLMIQREVAERLVARPRTKEYGILSVSARLFGSASMLFDVSPNCFFPKPKVTSTMVHLRMHPGIPADVDAGFLRSIIRTAFGKRRKTLRNSLCYLPPADASIAHAVAELDFPLDKRPEELTADDFIDLARKLRVLIGSPSIAAQTGA